MAKDEFGASSAWSEPIPISMPKQKNVLLNKLHLFFGESHFIQFLIELH
jgi:hypothetical protein